MNVDILLPQLFDRLNETFWPSETIWPTPLIKMALLASALRSIGVSAHLVQRQLNYGDVASPEMVHRGTLYALRVQDRLLNLKDHGAISWEDLARSYVFGSSHWIRYPAVVPLQPQGPWQRFKGRLLDCLCPRSVHSKFWDMECERIAPDYSMDPDLASSVPMLVSFSSADIAQSQAIATALVLEQDTHASPRACARARL